MTHLVFLIKRGVVAISGSVLEQIFRVRQGSLGRLACVSMSVLMDMRNGLVPLVEVFDHLTSSAAMFPAARRRPYVYDLT